MAKKVIYGQSMKDVCMNVYGSIGNFAKMLIDNNYSASNVPVVNAAVIYDETEGNLTIKNYYTKNNIIPSSGRSESLHWILDTGYWDDTANWVDTKIWID